MPSTVMELMQFVELRNHSLATYHRVQAAADDAKRIVDALNELIKHARTDLHSASSSSAAPVAGRNRVRLVGRDDCNDRDMPAKKKHKGNRTDYYYRRSMGFDGHDV